MNNKSAAKTLITRTLSIFSFIKHYQGCCKMYGLADKLLPVKVFLSIRLRSKLVYTCCLFFFTAGLTHAVNLVTVDDNYGIPASRFLQVEPFGVLENDTLDEQNAGENGVTVILVSSVTNGTLNCPTSPGSELCADGSFDYTPGPGFSDPGFSGTDSFTYQASIDVDVSAITTVTLSACNGGPTIFTCWHQAPYLAKLSDLGYSVFLEGFEGAAWDVVRSPDIGPSITASSITSKGITWTSNHPFTNGITTGSGPTRTGLWGGFDPAHGLATVTDSGICDVDVVPTGCRPHDGVSGKILSGGDKLHGVGGYITGFTNASIAIILDGTPYNVGKLPDSGHHFYGVIDASVSGFSGFEFQEQDGKSGQELLIFGDDFFIATSTVVAVNHPPALDMIDDQTVNEDVLLEIKLTASDPDDGDSWSFSMSGEPAGSSLNNNDDGTANFSWRPNFNQAGSYLVNFMVTDNGIPSQSDSTTITILVNDVVHPPGNLQFSAATYNVAENASSATITVRRTGGSAGAASVNYISSDGTAIAGSDYSLSSGTINFSDGDTMAKTFIVSIIDDTIFEANETVNLTLSGATGASLGAQSSAVLNITENDTALRGSLQFSALTYTVTEEGSSATITVNRVGGSFGTVGVDYASANGSAIAGSDYTAVSGSLSFADSVTSQTFSIDIIDDADFEGDETLNLTLSHTTGGAGLGSQSLAVLTISENDPVPLSGNLQFSAASYSVAENAGTATITVTRVGGSFGLVEVNYASTDGSATDSSAMAGSDYTTVSGSLSFADGVVSQTFNVTILDDTTYEGDESLQLSLSNPTVGAGLSTPGTASLLIVENELISDAGNNNASTGSGGIDLITLILLLSLYRRKIQNKNTSYSTTID